MARAIAGGLTFSTIVTLLALPCIYSLLDDSRLWVRKVIRDAREGRVIRRTEPQAAMLTASVPSPH
jgi:hydrophobic/amphiphilic exporter-1 (mainly G- bacteria), HAE1 family